MRNWKGLVGGFVLAGIFISAIGMYSHTYDKEDKEDETTRKDVQIPVWKEDTREYFVGDEVENGDFIWKVTSAEIINNRNLIKWEYIENSEIKTILKEFDYGKIYSINTFEDELKFLKLEFEVKNNSTNSQEINLDIEFGNIGEDGVYSEWRQPLYVAVGGEYQTTTQASYITNEKVALESGDTLKCTYIMSFWEGWESNYLYDLYMSVPRSGFVAGSASWNTSKKICLGISPKNLSVYQTQEKNAYDNQRDVPSMKANNRTNLQNKKYQPAGYPMQGESANGDTVFYLTENITDFSYVFGESIQKTILDSQVLSWNDFVSTNQHFHEGLSKMAQRYQEECDCTQEELKVLLVDYKYNITDNVQTDMYLYDYTQLFTRDKDGKRWLFGEADDLWLLDSNKGIDLGKYSNRVIMSEGDTITIQAAYILPPQIYEQEDALYYAGGELKRYNVDNSPITEIVLQ